MRYFLDTEFCEKPGSIDLISIGIVAEDGREFYACNLDAKLREANDWVKANVIPKLPPMDHSAWMYHRQIREAVLEFVEIDKAPEFWGYYADYDWVVFCWLFGSMIDLPSHFPMFCRDLKQLAEHVGADPKSIVPPSDDKHDALVDARWNRDLYYALSAPPWSRGGNKQGRG